ncbi:unnamed protein product, partial [marine sediment metagenome]
VRLRMKNVPRVSCYAKALDILRKTDEELKQLAEAGLDIVYMGLESGSSKILRIMKKGTNSTSIIKAGKKVLKSGIDLSLYVMLGLGGKKLSEDHVKGTARVLTEINPTIFRFRTLNILPTTPLWEDWKSGDFELLSPLECLIEERDIIKNLGENVTSQVFNFDTSLTIGVNFHSIDLRIRKIDEINNSKEPYNVLNCSIFDFGGQERFKALIPKFLGGANGVLLVFDLTSKKSFEQLNFWYDQVVEHAKGLNLPKILVGSKSDLVSSSVTDTLVPEEKIRNFIQEKNID